METTAKIINFLHTTHPYDVLPESELAELSTSFSRKKFNEGDVIYAHGDLLEGLYLIKEGAVEIIDINGAQVSLLQKSNHFGERGLLRDGHAATTATARMRIRAGFMTIPWRFTSREEWSPIV